MDEPDLDAIAQRELASRPPAEIRCCIASGCLSSNSASVLDSLQASIARQAMGEKVRAVGVGCLRLCGRGPLVRIEPDGGSFEFVRPEDAPSIVASVGGAVATASRCDASAPFFSRQASVVLENSGIVEPERIESALARGAYRSLWQVLRDSTPAEVVQAIERSGLRGRGGAGYPTGIKWALVAKSNARRKFVVCNADEGDPGAFMNRCEIESDPHRILEGMAIAGYAVGASQGYIYVRGEYALAVRRLQLALRQAGQLRLLGSHVFNSPFNFRIDIRVGAGAFVCGEETALMASIEGRRGTPSPRPPYPAENGLWGYPTLIQNVETFANIPVILRNGPEWFAAIGSPTAPGTKVFSLTGKVRNTGLVEVPIGTPIRAIVEEIGGGSADGTPLLAVQTGGPSGGCIPARLFDTPADYESLRAIGSIMGSGGMIVLDQSSDIVDVARYFMEFCKDESCGKCIPCRAGTVQMHRLLQKLVERRATPADLSLLESLGDMVGQTSLCGLGQTAPNPVKSTLLHFREEYESRLVSDPRLPVLSGPQ